MDLKKLDKSFYPENTHLKQALDLIEGKWITGKSRGHGIVVISVKGLLFAIPLLSNILHSSSYPTQGKHGSKHKGLDYSKALLLTKISYVSNEIFRIPNAEKNKLRNKNRVITQKFTQYVVKYIKAIETDNQRILNSLDYRFTTLQNYHAELGVEPD